MTSQRRCYYQVLSGSYKEKAIIIISTRDHTFVESIKDLTNLTIDAVKYSRVTPKDVNLLPP